MRKKITLTANVPVTVTLKPSSAGTVVADAVRLVDTTTPSRDFAYRYDVNGQNIEVLDQDPEQRVDSYRTSYDVLGQPIEVSEYDGSTQLRSTGYTHDPNGNILTVESVLRENATTEKLRRKTSYAWDARNQLDTLTVTNNPVDAEASRTWDYTWNSRGLLDTLRKPADTKAATSGNLVRYSYYGNGLLRQKEERQQDPGQTLVSSHELTYNPDGDLARDLARVTNPDGGMLRQTSTYRYSPSQQLLEVTKSGTGTKDEAYTYDPAGNITEQTIGKATTTSSYVDNRLERTTSTEPGFLPTTADYKYDDFGRLDQITQPRGEHQLHLRRIRPGHLRNP